MTSALLIVLGVAAAGVGGELFVRGTVGLAVRFRVAPGIVGATVAAFATSSPELSVGVNSAAQGTPEIALGDALGSNVVNVGLVLGMVLVLAGARPRRADLNRDLPVALIAPMVTLGLASDGVISRVDGGVLLACFAAWLAVTVRQAVRERDASASVLAETRQRWVVRDAVIGVVLLVAAGRMIVVAAHGIGTALGWDNFTVGAVLVAFGTSTPELATTITGLLVVGVAALITPIRVSAAEILAAVVAGVLTLALILPGRRDRLGRGRGLALIALYGVYVTVLLAVHR
jgi:cation:H+ antiporter